MPAFSHRIFFLPSSRNSCVSPRKIPATPLCFLPYLFPTRHLPHLFCKAPLVFCPVSPTCTDRGRNKKLMSCDTLRTSPSLTPALSWPSPWAAVAGLARVQNNAAASQAPGPCSHPIEAVGRTPAKLISFGKTTTTHHQNLISNSLHWNLILAL